MKKLNLLFTALLLLCCIGTAKAEEVTIDGTKYDVVTKAKLATVIKGGNYSGEIVIPSEITHNDVIYSVTSIGYEAFSDCIRLTSITIPNSVTSIGNRAFYWCTGLTSINIPNSVTSIGQSAFYNCSGLTSITIPNSVTSIGDYAFSWCTGLASVVIGNSVTSIGNEAFNRCSKLKSIEIPNSVTSIEQSAFEDYTGLTSVVIGNSVTSIREKAFRGCTGLKEVHISDLEAWCNISFGGSNANPLYYPGNLYLNGELLTELAIPSSIAAIKNCAFYNCSGLTSITIPNSVTSIGNSAFYGCTGLTSVEIPNSLTNIGSYAFNGCSGLTSVTVGTGVKKIYSEAFAKCSNLTDVYCLATSVPSTNATAFNESYPEYMTLHVPAEAIDSYRTTAPWSSFGTIVTLDGETPEIPETPKCANPVISYTNGKLSLECETEGTEFITDVTCSDIKKFYDSEIAFSATYNISVYATATGYENSDIVNATLCWVECECEGSDDTSVINIPTTAALVTSNGGILSISCQLDGAEVAVYTTDGMLVAATTIENGQATIATGLSKGAVAIVKIGDKSIKVVVN